MAKMKLSPPWVTYANEVKELFAADPDVHVVFDCDDMDLKLFVDDDSKAEALTELLPEEKDFGGAKLKISVVPANANDKPSVMSLLRKAFAGNPAVRNFYECQTPFGQINYVVFAPEIVQFWNDDMSDINGNKTMLLKDVAEDVIGETSGVNFCTDAISPETAKPLGEWP